MKPNNPLFSDKYLNSKFQHLELLKIENLSQKLDNIRVWQQSIKNNAIIQSKEESLQGDFLNKFFVETLNYSNQKDTGAWFLETEQKAADGKKMDAALGFFSIDNKTIHADVRVVIELKNAKTDLDKPQTRKNDNRTPVQQAFDYANSLGGLCRWIIVSNFIEIRLYYQTDRTRYQCFSIADLDKEARFKQFYFLLNKDRLINQTGDSITDKLYAERQAQEIEISKKFYADYKQARLTFFHSLKAYNPNIDDLVLLNKTQKLLDRLLFIHFCEDYNIIDTYTLRQLIDNAKRDLLIREKDKIYRRICALFSAINEGYPELRINKFNGGLFAEDAVFNSLIVDDDILKPVLALVDYDLASDLNVNILGHIFEQSISDIEELKADISGESFDKKQGKRKKDGIYYTPDYITRYIVEEAIGGWLTDRREELHEAQLPELTDDDLASVRIVARGKHKGKFECNAAVQVHLDFYDAYKERLVNIKVVDPACGSGAFLNQAFDFLYAEGQRVNNELLRLRGGQLSSFDLDKQILENNLFGVDLNEESVEITKLSLWLKTANRYNPLTSLDDNIKCGNSLCDDITVAGDKAFVWELEFKAVMDKGGFDVVIGNPPYAVLSSFAESEFFYYLQKKYKTAFGRINLFALFIERVTQLVNNNFKIGLIIPDSICLVDYYTNLRKYILDNYSIQEIVELGDGVFESATVPSIIFIIKNKIEDNVSLISKGNIFLGGNEKSSIEQNYFYKTTKYSFNLYIDSIFIKLRNIIDDTIFYKLCDVAKINIGVCTGDNKKYISDKPIFPVSKKVLQGKDVHRYEFTFNNIYLNYDRDILLRARKESIFIAEEKLLMRQTSDKLILSYDNQQFYAIDSLFVIRPLDEGISIKYLLVLLNSRLLNYQYQILNPEAKRVFAQIKIDYVNELPIKKIIAMEQQLFIKKADLMLEQNKNLQQLQTAFLNFIQVDLKPQKLSNKLQHYYDLSWDEFKTELKKVKVDLNKHYDLKKVREWQTEFESEKQQALAIKAIIVQTDKEIDTMVYALYGLDADDIAVIENS